jgi:PAS domain-containing protein
LHYNSNDILCHEIVLEQLKGIHMQKKSTHEELIQRVKELEKEAAERRRAEEALGESEVRLKTVLDTIQAGIVVIDPKKHIIVGVNAAAGNMVGSPRE